MSKFLKTKAMVACSVAVITAAVFLPSLRNEFVNWDDGDYVYNNPFIRSLDLHLLRSAFTEFHASNWHPLTWLSHALDYAMWGLNPLGHHLTNVMLHALNTFVVVLLVAKLMEAGEIHPYPNPPPSIGKAAGKNPTPAKKKGRASPPKKERRKGDSPPLKDWDERESEKDNGRSTIPGSRRVLITAGVTGLLFGLHPLHVESVAWVAERKDLLCGLFFLLSIITYTGYASGIKAYGSAKSASRFFSKKYLLAIAFFVLSLLSKPMAVTLPFVLLILDWCLFRRIQSLKTFWTAIVEKLPFFVLALISSVLTIMAQEAGGAIKSVKAIPLTARLIVAVESLIAYLAKMVLPLNLLPFYPYPEKISFFSLKYIIPIVILLGVTAACAAVIKKQKLWMAVWSYYVITLIPVLGIVQVGDQAMADRYTYLPSLGPFLLIGLTAAKIYENATASQRSSVMSRIAALVISVTVLVSISSATVKQIGIWKYSIVFWNYVIDKEPGRVPFAHNNLGNAYRSDGRLDMAIEQYRTALSLKPDYADARNNLGTAYINLGNEYRSNGRLDMAIEQYRTALRLMPDFADAHIDLGNAYISKGLVDMAIEQYKTAISLMPGYAMAHNNLGNAYKSKGQLDMAIVQYRTALSLMPDYAMAHFNLGLTYMEKGSKDMARKEFERVLAIKPGDRKALQALNSMIAK